jgi:cyclopropane fatty-acyl-phospholipid synthase-like methyltransferase
MNDKIAKQLQDFARLWGGFRASRVILTANNLGVFDQLQKPKSAADIAHAIGTDPRATEILLNAATALRLLKKSAGNYRNTDSANTFLVKGSPFYQGDMLRHADNLWKSWSGLDEVVRTGKPNRSGTRDYDAFIRAMHNNAVFRAKKVIDAIDLKNVTRALDLGGGPGTYSMELAKRKIIVTLFDLPETVRIAQEIVGEQKTKQIHFLAGDYHTDDIGSGYDLVLISQIVHSLSEEESVALIEKSRDALAPKGTIAVHEFLLEKNRAFPVPGALFSVNMLVNTPAGRSYTAEEMRGWITKAGFKGIKVKALGETVVVTGRKG